MDYICMAGHQAQVISDMEIMSTLHMIMSTMTFDLKKDELKSLKIL